MIENSRSTSVEISGKGKPISTMRDLELAYPEHCSFCTLSANE